MLWFLLQCFLTIFWVVAGTVVLIILIAEYAPKCGSFTHNILSHDVLPFCAVCLFRVWSLSSPF